MHSQVVVELKGLADRYEKAVVEEDKLTAGPSSPPRFDFCHGRPLST
jgi:hypothetical protein